MVNPWHGDSNTENTGAGLLLISLFLPLAGGDLTHVDLRHSQSAALRLRTDISPSPVHAVPGGSPSFPRPGKQPLSPLISASLQAT